MYICRAVGVFDGIDDATVIGIQVALIANVAHKFQLFGMNRIDRQVR